MLRTFDARQLAARVKSFTAKMARQASEACERRHAPAGVPHQHFLDGAGPCDWTQQLVVGPIERLAAG